MLSGLALDTVSAAGTVIAPRDTPSTTMLNAVPDRRHSTVCQSPSATLAELRTSRMIGDFSSTSTQLGRPARPSTWSLYWLLVLE